MAPLMAQRADSTEEKAIMDAITNAEAATAHNKPWAALKERKKRIGKEKAADFETDGRQFLAESEAGELENGAKPKRVDSGIAPADAEATVSVVTTYTLWNVTRTKTFEIAAQPKALHQRAYSMVSSTVVWSVDGGVPERMPVHPPSWDREEEKAGDTVLCGLTAGERRRTVGP